MLTVLTLITVLPGLPLNCTNIEIDGCLVLTGRELSGTIGA
jgi:hypothetical protein